MIDSAIWVINRSMNIYYVYLYLDPSRNDQPFYVGMGKGRRDKSHLRNPDGRKNLPFYNRLLKMKKANITPTIVRVAESLTQNEAFDLEVSLIAKHKRRHEGGTLLNITSGGIGFSSPAPIQSNGKKRIAWNRGIPQSDETKAKLSKAIVGFRHSDEAKAKIADRSAGANNPSAKEWVLVDPFGVEHTVISLRTFCQENDLVESSFRINKNSDRVISRGKSKGWSCRWKI
jgi:hypothetical protein